MKIETITYDCGKPDGQWFTVVWYPENDGELAFAADRHQPGDKISYSLVPHAFGIAVPGTVIDKFGYPVK